VDDDVHDVLRPGDDDLAAPGDADGAAQAAGQAAEEVQDVGVGGTLDSHGERPLRGSAGDSGGLEPGRGGKARGHVQADGAVVPELRVRVAVADQALDVFDVGSLAQQ